MIFSCLNNILEVAADERSGLVRGVGKKAGEEEVRNALG